MKLKLSRVKPSAKVTRREGSKLIGLGVLAAAGGLAGYRYRNEIADSISGLVPSGTDSNEAIPAIMFVTTGDKLNSGEAAAVNSVKIKEACEENGVQYRKYDVKADLFQETQWARDMHEAGVKFGGNCMVIVDRAGRGRCRPLPANVAAALDVLRRSYAV